MRVSFFFFFDDDDDDDDDINYKLLYCFDPWCPDGRAGGRGKKFVLAVSQKP